MKTNKHEHGFIEKREVMMHPDKIALYKYFLVITDAYTKRLLSTYGPTDSPEEAAKLAQLHGVILES